MLLYTISCGSCTSTGDVSQTINRGQQVHAVSDTPIQHHNTLTRSLHDWKCIQNAITIIAFSLHFADPGDEGHPVIRLLHMSLSMQTSLSILLVISSPRSPHTQTHCHFIISVSRRTSPEYLPTFSTLPRSSPSKQ